MKTTRHAWPVAGSAKSLSNRVMRTLSTLRFRQGIAAAVTICLLLVLGGGERGLYAAGEKVVDLELILAVDTSSSVSQAEFELQMRGLSEAFRNTAVAEALEASGDLGVAVALVQWADNRKQIVSIDWTVIHNAEQAMRFADEIDATPRFVVGGGTAIGGAIKFGLRQLERNEFEGRRKVIDISGDGRTNQGVHPQRLKDVINQEGVTVNGLAILNEDPAIGRYYRDFVITGTGAFVMSATNYEDFSAAMLEKLVKEISGTPIARRVPPRRLPPPAT
jgi:hypothetical protein